MTFIVRCTWAITIHLRYLGTPLCTRDLGHPFEITDTLVTQAKCVCSVIDDHLLRATNGVVFFSIEISSCSTHRRREDRTSRFLLPLGVRSKSLSRVGNAGPPCLSFSQVYVANTHAGYSLVGSGYTFPQVGASSTICDQLWLSLLGHGCTLFPMRTMTDPSVTASIPPFNNNWFTGESTDLRRAMSRREYIHGMYK